jgi:leucyl/phenylalanyl-tRNA--protein transferase
MYLLGNNLSFPPVDCADENGLLAIGGDLSANRLMLAYKSGIFPWYNQGEPIIWYSPNPRMVLFPKELKVSKSMKQLIKSNKFRVTYNQNFEQVIAQCKSVIRKNEAGTWITDEMEAAYNKLHKLGYAKSVEVWEKQKLVGGLYGIDLGTVFCGESMFSLVSNASKLAFIFLVEKLKTEGYKLIDCQVYNSHLASLGAKEIPRSQFLKYLNFQ